MRRIFADIRATGCQGWDYKWNLLRHKASSQNKRATDNRHLLLSQRHKHIKARSFRCSEAQATTATWVPRSAEEATAPAAPRDEPRLAAVDPEAAAATAEAADAHPFAPWAAAPIAAAEGPPVSAHPCRPCLARAPTLIPGRPARASAMGFRPRRGGSVAAERAAAARAACPDPAQV